MSDLNPGGIKPSREHAEPYSVANPDYGKKPRQGRTKQPKSDAHNDCPEDLDARLDVPIPCIAKLLEIGHNVFYHPLTKGVCQPQRQGSLLSGIISVLHFDSRYPISSNLQAGSHGLSSCGIVK